MPKTDKPTQKAALASHNTANDNGAALTVSYRWDEGLLVCGQTRAYKDAIKSARVRLQRLRFSRWLPEDCAWYLPNSRRKPLAEQALRTLADHLRDQGVPSVAVRYDPAPPQGTQAGEGGPSFAEREAERSARAQDRVERRKAQTERKQRQSEALFKEGEDAVKHIPFGQPVLVGHHSEARHRKALKKAQDKGFAGLDKHREAKAAASRARGTERHLRQRTDPGVTRRRIARLQAELRKIERNLHGHPGGGMTLRAEPATGEHRQRLLAMQADLTEQVAYWQAELAKLDAKDWSQADFAKGDQVLTHHGWGTVLRANPKTLTVNHHNPAIAMLNPHKVPYDRVQDRKPAPAGAAPKAPSKAPAPAKTTTASTKPAAKPSKKKAAKKVTKKTGPELPPLAKHDSYHFGPEGHEAGSMRHDEQGYNVITAGLTTATFKTQAGAERWLKKKLRPEDWKAVRIFRARTNRFGPVRKVEAADPILDKVERFVALLNDSPGIEPYRYEAHKRRKYIAIDRALPAARTRSGVFLVDADGHVYTIKGYGVPKNRITTLDEALAGKWQTRHGTPMRAGKGAPKPPAQPPKPASKPPPAPPTQTELSAGPRALQALELELSLSDPDTHQQLARLQSLLQWNRKTGAYDAHERPARTK